MYDYGFAEGLWFSLMEVPLTARVVVGLDKIRHIRCYPTSFCSIQFEIVLHAVASVSLLG
jgi:hypothetical protein